MKKHYDFSKGVIIRTPGRKKSDMDKAWSRQQKVLTSIRLDPEIVEVAKRRAEEDGVGYLTWLNTKLREAVLGEEGLQSRVRRLEKAVFKKKTEA